jgi:hypothetical protein
LAWDRAGNEPSPTRTITVQQSRAGSLTANVRGLPLSLQPVYLLAQVGQLGLGAQLPRGGHSVLLRGPQVRFTARCLRLKRDGVELCIRLGDIDLLLKPLEVGVLLARGA